MVAPPPSLSSWPRVIRSIPSASTSRRQVCLSDKLLPSPAPTPSPVFVPVCLSFSQGVSHPAPSEPLRITPGRMYVDCSNQRQSAVRSALTSARLLALLGRTRHRVESCGRLRLGLLVLAAAPGDSLGSGCPQISVPGPWWMTSSCLSSGLHVSLSGCVAAGLWRGVAYPDLL